MKRIILAMGFLLGAIPVAQGQDYTGYIGVYVSPSDFGGMTIQRFIPNTPASKANIAGQIRRGDTIVKLAGRPVNSHNDLNRARNLIPYGREGKLVLRGPDGSYYFVWISRKDPAVAAAAYGGYGVPVEAARAAASDGFRPGGQGDGSAYSDIRDADGVSDDAVETSPVPVETIPYEEGDIR